MQAGSNHSMSMQGIILPHKETKDSGLLSIKLEGHEHLLKIYFELGLIVGLSMGTLKNAECLHALGKCNPVEAVFLKGYKTPDYAATEDQSISAQIQELFASNPVTGSVASTETKVSAPAVSAASLASLEDAFINIMGPIGRMILDTAYTDLGYHRGADMPASQYSQLIGRLQENLPGQFQSAFAEKYAVGPALEKHHG